VKASAALACAVRAPTKLVARRAHHNQVAFYSLPRAARRALLVARPTDASQTLSTGSALAHTVLLSEVEAAKEPTKQAV